MTIYLFKLIYLTWWDTFVHLTLAVQTWNPRNYWTEIQGAVVLTTGDIRAVIGCYNKETG